MFKELDKVVVRFEELTTLLSNPEIVKNPQQFRETSKTHSDLKPIVEAYSKHKELLKQIEENKHIISEESDSDMRNMAIEENSKIETELDELELKLKLLLLPKDPRDDKNVILEIRAGTGGDEAALFASDLFRMYQRFAETKRWKVEILSMNDTGLGGIKEVICAINGEKVYSFLKFESGIHRVQRVPTTETSGRIHTSAATVAVLPEAEEIDIQIDATDIRVDVYRSSGPGGQSVNRTDSAVRITHLSSGLVVTCQDEKSQHKNKAKALKILRSRLYDLEQKKQQDAETKNRREQIGSGDRSEKIRTYNFPQNRLTDHRIGLTLHRLNTVLEGDLDEVISSLQAYYQAQALKQS